MKVQYLGTAAAERIPGMFCDCEVCRRALALGGKNIMTQAQVLIDDKLLVDFSGDTYHHFQQLGRTLWDIEDVLITHSHIDHFTFESFVLRTPGVAHGVTREKLRFYTSAEVIDRVWDCLSLRNNKKLDKIPERVEFVAMDDYRTVSVGDYLVTPFPAEHAGTEQAFIYLIEGGGKTLFYGNDTGYFPETIDDWLRDNGKHIDLLSLDCTKGDAPYTYKTHMGMQEGRMIADRFLRKGIIDDSTLCLYTHFSHNCGMIHDELAEAAKAYGFGVTHDGMTVEI